MRVYRGFVIWSSESWKLEDSEVSSDCRRKTSPKREERASHPWCSMGPQSTVLFSVCQAVFLTKYNLVVGVQNLLQDEVYCDVVLGQV